ncbi:hypothetical protein HHK36_031270 [Tetracentron sinense]|uniref:Cytochrome P450 n=1 Tax=Tetracentron sinense TaxID=13715 RepID=A0A834YD80_TETSI|nr:hypothetical protein HHK36_031270 [Tetracentron sinense]
MESPLEALHMFFALPLLFLLCMCMLVRSRQKLPYPPGPKGLPLIGNMSMMDQLTHRGLAGLAKQYGGILHLKMGMLHFVVVSTPEMARHVLKVQDNIFSNRPATVAARYLTYGRADMAFANYGPFWRQMRKICVMRLFSRKRAESWVSVRDEVDSMVRTVAAKSGSVVNIGELVFTLTMNIINRAAFGSVSHEGQDEFVSILHEFSTLFGAFNIADFIPWLGWVDPKGLNKKLVMARQSLDRFMDTIIDTHMMKKKNNNKVADDMEVDPDMVDDLLAFYREDTIRSESNDLNGSIHLTRDNIKAIIMVHNKKLNLSCSTTGFSSKLLV